MTYAKKANTTSQTPEQVSGMVAMTALLDSLMP